MKTLFSMKRFTTCLASSLFLLLGLAFAHSDLESSTPADGSVLAEAPKQIVLNFAEEAQLDFSTFKVYPLPLSPEAMAMMEAEPVTEEALVSDATVSETASGEAATSEATSSTEGEPTEDAEHAEGEAHSEESSSEGATSHTDELMDTAAEEFIPSVLDLTGDEAARVDTGLVEKDTSATVTLTLKENLAPGAYVVMWRVLSVDTHTVEGSLTFYVK
jgi:copper resistance protein C